MNYGKGMSALAEYITEAVNADADESEECYARVIEMPMPDGSRATVLIMSGDHHDELCEFVRQGYPGARKVRTS